MTAASTINNHFDQSNNLANIRAAANSHHHGFLSTRLHLAQAAQSSPRIPVDSPGTANQGGTISYATLGISENEERMIQREAYEEAIRKAEQ